MATILVTGAIGFIGTNICQYLLKQGWNILGVDNFEDNYAVAIKQRNLQRLKQWEHFQFAMVDIRNRQALRQALATIQVDVVLHLAAKVGITISHLDFNAYVSVNVNGTQQLLEWMRESSCKKLIFASSSSVYGDAQVPRFQEDVTPLKPLNPYAATKIFGEHLTYHYHLMHDIDVFNLRFFNVYGCHGRPDMAVYKFTAKILRDEPIIVYGTGQTQRDWTHIEDITEGIAKALIYLLHQRNIYESINLGHCNPVALNTLIQRIEQVLNKKATIQYEKARIFEMSRTCADITKAAQLFDYAPKIPIYLGIELFVKWYLEEQALL
ncbi:MAG: hypothetical protein RLZZ292_1400 [Bacteroidota bacterium]|jgi:nucleoside-diphosphate-sugar epimerase